MGQGLFVTGTDTGVGKTLAACALLHALRRAGIEAAPMKPVAAGATAIDGRWLNDDTRALLEAAGWPLARAGEVTPILLREAIAPHIAAAREGATLRLDDVAASIARFRDAHGFVVVEGVGGFRVPLQDGDTAELARRAALPVVLVVGLRLGCLNHALLTAQAVEAAGLPLAGWIANALDAAMPALEENVETLRERIGAPMLGRFPHQATPDARRLAAGLDLRALLEATR